MAGIFVLLAVPVTIYEVAMHLEYFSRPRLQIYVIRILWMVPIYAVDAWLALKFKVGVGLLLHTLLFSVFFASAGAAQIWQGIQIF